MNIAKINEFLVENERIKAKIVEIKRKLNLRNYSEEQKSEFRKILKMLKEMFHNNQYSCVELSKTSAYNFAEIIKKALNKSKCGMYEISYQVLNFNNQTSYANVLKHFRKQDRAVFLVVTNKNASHTNMLTLDDINNIPIVWMNELVQTDIIDTYTRFMLDKKKVSIFNDVSFSEDWEDHHTIKTFNLGKPSVVDKTKTPQMRKLCELIKQELGIYNSLSQTQEKQQ